VMLPHSVALVAARAPAAIGRLAGALGAPDEHAGAAAGEVAKLAALAGIRGLADLGVSETELDRLTAGALRHPAMANTPGGVSEAEIRSLLREAL